MAPKRHLEDIVTDGNGPQVKKGKVTEAAPSRIDDTAATGQGSDVQREARDATLPSTPHLPAESEKDQSRRSSVTQPDGIHAGTAGGSSDTETRSQTDNVLTPKDDEELESYRIFDVADRERFKRVLSFRRPSDHTYSILSFPRDLVWGRISGFKTLPSNTLHVKGTDAPVVLWHIGEITKAYFYTPQGDLYDNVLITISPLTSSGIAASQRLLRTFSDSGAIPLQESTLEEVRASCWTNTGDNKGRASPFQEVYDAMTRLGRKTQMTGLDATDLHIGDVVMVETTVTRYRVNTERGRNGPQRASYELHSIALLRRAPAAEKRYDSLRALDDPNI